MKIDFGQIKSFYDGKAGLIAGLCQQVNLDTIFNKHLEQHQGRPTDISYGIMAQLMLINMADDHHPLSRMDEYFQNTDLETIFGIPIDINKLNDDRFGGFLDAMVDAGCLALYSELSVSAFKRYGIKLSNINFDTTSKVMWGQYETSDGTAGVVDITFGYSKQKRFDKKQIKFALGTTQGICIDGLLLSGNADDKHSNIDYLDRAVQLREQFELEQEEFFYIADSAAFTKAFLQKSRSLGIELITRMPDNIKEGKKALEYAWLHLNELPTVEVPTSTKPSLYRVYETECVYQGIPLKMAVCYSEKLKFQKAKTLEKRILNESKTLEKLAKTMNQRSFACLEDAQLEINKLNRQELNKLQYHKVSIEIESQEIRRRGRPSQDTSKDTVGLKYTFTFAVTKDEKSMKSPQFVNSFFVDSPRRVEALGYLLLILMLLLSVAEYLVRRGLENDKLTIVGPGKIKMDRPSLMAIYRIFFSVATSTVKINGLSFIEDIINL
ncbi:IS1634 family transposase [Serpentinicella alkaliphila]|nr:IS1634 family transposase [Serpentinicella alkaliphila]QUH26184.1 IS1634 family transposase [Serpentinicella alkaliphila]